MNLIRPYGETAQNLSVAGTDGERRDVARRLISQTAGMCLMCACALDSAFMDGRPMPEGIYHENVTEAVERALLQAARDLSAVQSVL